MSIDTAALEKLVAADNTKYGQGLRFSDVLSKELGSEAWEQLEPAIARRFSPRISGSRALCFRGSMQWVYCSPIGRMIASLLKNFHVLPKNCARHQPFDFTISQKNGVIQKQRRYGLGQEDCFTFTSLFYDNPQLHEEFAGGLGMYLGLAVKRGSLLFRDRAYFFRIGRWRMSLPRWLTVGRFELLHKNISDKEFQIIIRVNHPLLGTLFYQRGEFHAA